MTTRNTTRRAMMILAGAAALPAVAALPALAAPAALAAAGAGTDVELRRLWKKYLQHIGEYIEAHDWHDPLRAAVEAEVDPISDEIGFDDHKKMWKASWRKHNVEPSWKAVNAAYDAIAATITAVRAAKAETLFGIGVKLAAMPLNRGYLSIEDFEDALRSAMPDLDRLSGGHFTASLPDVLDEFDPDDDEA